VPFIRSIHEEVQTVNKRYCLPIAFALALAGAGGAWAKDCTSSDPNVRLATGYCDVPAAAVQIDGTGQKNSDPFYALDCVQISTGSPISGVNRFFVANADLDCDGPQTGTITVGTNTIPVFGPPDRLELIEEVERDVVLDRSLVDGVTGTGPVSLGTLTDSVFRDSTDGSLVLTMHLALNPTLPEAGGAVPNESEFNFFLRSGNAGHTVQAASSDRRRGGNRLYNASRTSAKILNGATPFNADVVRFQSDINVIESNPTTRWFHMRTTAECYTVRKSAIELNQAGEEGQPNASVFLDGFVSAAACVDNPAVTATVSYPFNPGSASTSVTELGACSPGNDAGVSIDDVTGCIEVDSTVTVPAPSDPDNWPQVCFDYSVPDDLDPISVAEGDLVGKKCESPGGDCCLVGAPDAPNACQTSCPGGSCGWDVAIRSDLSETADVGGGDPTGRYCIATPSFSEFSLATFTVDAPPAAAAQVPFPWLGLGALAAGLGAVATAARRRARG